MKIAVKPLPFRHYILACLLTIAGLGLLAPLAFGQSTSGAGAMKIGIIGAGNIGSTVGTMWINAGHQVMFSSRHPEELKPLVDRLGPLARAGTVKQALDFGDVMLMAVPYGVYGQIGRDYAKEFIGKIVLDAGNAVLARDGEIGKEARAKSASALLRLNISLRRASCGRSISWGGPVGIQFPPARGKRWQFRSLATTRKRSKLRPNWCATPDSSRC